MALILIGHPDDHDPGGKGLELPVVIAIGPGYVMSVQPSKNGNPPLVFATELERAAAAAKMSRKLGVDVDLKGGGTFALKPFTDPIAYAGKVVTAEVEIG